MSEAVHKRPPELEGVPIEDIAERCTARFRDRKADWDAFADARIEGYKRAQHRFIGAGGSGKHGDPTVIPPGNFTLSIMYVEPGQGNAAHTHEVEEVFFVLQGYLTAFFEDEAGKRVDVRLGPWECVSCPPGVIHGYVNESLEPVYFQVMLGKARPELMGYTDQELLAQRDVHLKETPSPLQGERAGERGHKTSLPIRRGLRNNATDAERLLWCHLRADQLGARFRRQHPVGPYVLDFYCPASKLAVEVDGGQHFQPTGMDADRRREQFLGQRGIKTLRFSNLDVLERPESVVAEICSAMGPLPRPLPGGEGTTA